MNMLDYINIDPEFFGRKLIGAPHDPAQRIGYHTSIKTWKQMRPAPLLYLSEHVEHSLIHMLSRVEHPGASIEFNLHTVEYPEVILADDYSMHWKQAWDEQAREYVEEKILYREAHAISFYHDLLKPDTGCVVLRKTFTRRISTQKMIATLVKPLPEPELLPGSSTPVLVYEGGILDYYSIVKVADNRTRNAAQTTRGTVRSAARQGGAA